MIGLIDQNYCKKQKNKYHNCDSKKRLLNIIIKKDVIKEKANNKSKNSSEKKKQKQKENMEEIGIKI